MGILGLRKFIEASSCTKFLPSPSTNDADSSGGIPNSAMEPNGMSSSCSTPARCADHVLVDLNCIIHSCFSREACMTKRDLIQAVLARLQVLLTQVLVPCVSLTICIDGPAPFAKLQTQRLRRRRVSLLDAGGADELTTLSITPGSLFLVELENAIAAQFKLNNGRGFLPSFVPVFLHGSTVIGEGEAKISRALAFLAYTPLPSRRRYNPNDSVVLVGNDIDLTLTCIGATPYHNLFVLSPSSLQVINVAELLYRWLCSSGDFCPNATHLASVRVDFVFLFLLNGGDHYPGAGEVADALWRRYRIIRGAHMYRALVSADLSALRVDVLADLFQSDTYTGEAEVSVGLELLRAALWSLRTVVTGECPDYAFIAPPITPHLHHIRAAIAHRQRRREGIRLADTRPSKPLTPLETFVALMPTEAALPKGVAAVLRRTKRGVAIARRLLGSHDAADVADAAREAVALAAAPETAANAEGEGLTLSEQYLREFTAPVQLNVWQPPKRLSRHAQHRMIATKGRVEREEPMPLVQRVEMPTEVQYVHVPYPNYARDLLFLTELHPHKEAGGSTNGCAAETDIPHTKHAHPVTGNARTKRTREETGRLVADAMRRIPAHPVSDTYDVSNAKRMESTLEQAAALRQPDGKDKKTLRRLKKRLHKQQLLGEKEAREAENDGARRYALRHNDKAFISELQQFLGEEGDTVMSLLREEEEKEKEEKKTQRQHHHTNKKLHARKMKGACKKDGAKQEHKAKNKNNNKKMKVAKKPCSRNNNKTPHTNGGNETNKSRKRQRDEEVSTHTGVKRPRKDDDKSKTPSHTKQTEAETEKAKKKKRRKKNTP